tara:strand:+ start:12433 stop:13437 length:1005 start_codon:yes stop_codon:yes gene_type:complete
MTKFLVIGSNSFSGSHFVSEALLAGYEVYGVSRSKEIDNIFLPYTWYSKEIENTKQFHFQKIDLNNQIPELIDLINDFKPIYIVNFAAQGMVAESWLNPIHWYRTNLISQVQLHDELRKMTFIKKYVHVTTPEVYGSTDKGWIKENIQFNPTTPYAVSRAACDLHLLSFYKAYDFPVVFTRAANVYGPGQQLYRIIPRTLLSALTKKTMKLHGGGLSERSFIHIKDVVRATLELSIKAEPGSTWHLSTEDSIQIKDLVRKICKLTNADFDKIVEVNDERLGKDQSYLLDSRKVRKEFSWKDEISLNNGLLDTLGWVENNLKSLEQMNWDYIHKL